MLEKLVWISAFMLVGAKHKANVGQVESSHKEEVSVAAGISPNRQVQDVGQHNSRQFIAQRPAMFAEFTAVSVVMTVLSRKYLSCLF
jgi:hypothetical protein